MKNLKQVTHQTIAQVRYIPSVKIGLMLAVIVGLAVLVSSIGMRVARADGGGESSQVYDIMFTKWMTSYPNMAGIITGGDAGSGTFAGQVLKVTKSTPKIWKAKVLYQIFGTAHSFSAHLHVRENDVTNTARVEGKVTEGWLKGSPVNGGYLIIPASGCPHPEFGPCYQVTLHIHGSAR